MASSMLQCQLRGHQCNYLLLCLAVVDLGVDNLRAGSTAETEAESLTMSNFIERQLNREIESFQVRIPTIENSEQAARMQLVLEGLLEQRRLLRAGFHYAKPKALAELQPAT